MIVKCVVLCQKVREILLVKCMLLCSSQGERVCVCNV